MNWNMIWGQAIAKPFSLSPSLAKSTTRFSVMSPLSGDQLRLRFSNIYGKKAYVIGECTVKANGVRCQVTQDGKKQLVIPCGGASYSDAVDLKVMSGENIEISIYPLNQPGEMNAIEESANLVKGANLTQSDVYPPIKLSRLAKKFNSYQYIPLIDSIEIQSPIDSAIIVAFGDSITQQSLWTKPLAAKLFEFYKDEVVLINKGIGANRILHEGKGLLFNQAGDAAKDRLDRDVLSLRGVAGVIFALGTNDIGWTKKNRKEYVSGEQLSTAIQEIVERLKKKSIKVIGTTILPRMGSMGYEPYHEITRKELNDWILSYKGFDHVVDLDRVTEDADKPGWLKAAYDWGDHLHPSQEGGNAMAEAFDVERLFKRLR